ncbi:hypothetical protein Tco_0356136 [Tanacetum coccineum]
MVGPSSSSDNTKLINNLDDGNPLHIQTNDNSNLAFIPFKLLGTENYRIWATVMKWLFRSEKYYDKVDGLNSLWKEFDALTKLPKCVCEFKCYCTASFELVLHQQLMKLMQFLMGMDDYYQPIRSALLTMDPLPEVKDAYTTVSREESHRGILESSGVSNSKLNATSFAAKSFNNNTIRNEIT